MIRFFVVNSREDICIEINTIQQDMNVWYSKRLLEKIHNPKWPASEDAIKYTTEFYNAVNTINLLDDKNEQL